MRYLDFHGVQSSYTDSPKKTYFYHQCLRHGNINVHGLASILQVFAHAIDTKFTEITDYSSSTLAYARLMNGLIKLEWKDK